VDWKYLRRWNVIAAADSGKAGQLLMSRSPDGAQRNPGLIASAVAPDCAALHPGYKKIFKSKS
jgi:hypothetical protein